MEVYKIYKKSNYIVIEDNDTIYYGLSKNIEVDKSNKKRPEYRFFNIRDWNEKKVLNISQIQKEDGIFYTEEEFDDFFTQKTGNFNWGWINPLTSESIIIVDSLESLPSPIGSEIFLNKNKTTYIVIGKVDLKGNRINSSNDIVNFFGLSSETSSLTSSGLPEGVPLFTSNTTIKIRDITLHDVDTLFNLVKDTTMALDWDAVNIVNIPNIGVISKCDNFIFNKGVIINSKDFTFDVSVGTIAFTDSLLQGDGEPGAVISLPSTLTITRRFRMDKCAFIVFGDTVGINTSISATIPVESYIIDTVNFSGEGTYISGITVYDNRAVFKNSKGIPASTEVSYYYMNNNLISTPIVAENTPVKIQGATISSSVTQKFTNTNNRATYTGSSERTFKVTGIASLTSGNNNQIGIYLAKNGVVLNETEQYLTTNGAGRLENVPFQGIVTLKDTEYVEAFIENNSALNPILVTNLNLMLI